MLININTISEFSEIEVREDVISRFSHCTSTKHLKIKRNTQIGKKNMFFEKFLLPPLPPYGGSEIF